MTKPKVKWGKIVPLYLSNKAMNKHGIPDMKGRRSEYVDLLLLRTNRLDKFVKKR